MCPGVVGRTALGKGVGVNRSAERKQREKQPGRAGRRGWRTAVAFLLLNDVRWQRHPYVRSKDYVARGGGGWLRWGGGGRLPSTSVLLPIFPTVSALAVPRFAISKVAKKLSGRITKSLLKDGRGGGGLRVLAGWGEKRCRSQRNAPSREEVYKVYAAQSSLQGAKGAVCVCVCVCVCVWGAGRKGGWGGVWG